MPYGPKQGAPEGVALGGDINNDGSPDFCMRFTQAVGCADLATGATLWRFDGDEYDIRDDRVQIVEEDRAYVIIGRCSPTGSCGINFEDFQYEIRDGDGGLVDVLATPCEESETTLCRLTRDMYQGGSVQRLPGNTLTFIDEAGDVSIQPETPPSAWPWQSWMLLPLMVRRMGDL